MKEMSDKEILDFPIAETRVRDMGAIAFLGWIAKKIDGAPAYSAANQELLMAVSAGWYGQMPELEKIRLFRKLLSLNVDL